MPEGKRPRRPTTLLHYLRVRIRNLAALSGWAAAEHVAGIEREAYAIIRELRASLRSRP